MTKQEHERKVIIGIIAWTLCFTLPFIGAWGAAELVTFLFL